MSEQTSVVAVIGAGPASLYATEVLAKEGYEVLILNRDIKPGGLAEFGIYPTKHKMKGGLRRYFDRILSRDNVHYRGNIRVGAEADITLEEVRELGVSARVVAVGAQGTKWLGLPGEDAESVFHAKDLVYHYNGLPPFSEREFPIGDDVVVVGMGNVSMDIVHWMVCEKQVKTVTAVARRGPAERKFTRKEYRLVSGAIDEGALDEELDRVAPAMEEVGQDPEEHRKALKRFLDTPLEKESETAFKMRFLSSPKSIEVDEIGTVKGLVCEKTTLKAPDKEGGRMGLNYLGEEVLVEGDTVVFAIGDAIEPSIGLPLSEDQRTFATVEEPWAEHPERPRYMVADPEEGEPIWDTFVVGWARKASDGLVGKARADAVQGCDEILAYLRGEMEEQPANGQPVDQILEAFDALASRRDLRTVNYGEVSRLKEMEEAEAEARGVEEFKFSSQQEMLERIGKVRPKEEAMG